MTKYTQTGGTVNGTVSEVEVPPPRVPGQGTSPKESPRFEKYRDVPIWRDVPFDTTILENEPLRPVTGRSDTLNCILELLSIIENL